MLKLFSKVWERSAPPSGTAKAATTRVASPAARVLGFLKELGAKRVLLHADRTAFESAKAAFTGIDCVWASNELAEMENGAPHPEDVDWRGFDASVAAGIDLPRRYRQLLRLMSGAHAHRPVFWIGEGFESCGGFVSAPAGVAEMEAFLFNHYDAVFGPLQFRIDAYHGPEVKRSWRILPPNQSHVIRLEELFPKRLHPALLAVVVEHPVLTRERHTRLPLCADVFWKDSLTTLPSSDALGSDIDQEIEFRLPAWRVREGEVALTLPNTEPPATSGSAIETVVDGKSEKAASDETHYVGQSLIRRNGVADDRFLGWTSRGFGTSHWFAMESAGAVNGPHGGSIAGDRVEACQAADRGSFAAEAEDLARYRRLERDGFVLEPHPVPLLAEGDELAFGFDADAANPRLRDYRIDYFDGRGRHLGTLRHTKDAPGPLFPLDLADRVGDGAKAQAKLALVATDWLKAKLRFKGMKSRADLLVRNRQTGDQDLTELQSCWRNLGTVVPGCPHWLSDDLGVIGRTRALGRVRCDHGIKTGIVVVNASGRLAYRKSARVTLAVFNHAGLQISTELTLPAFTARLVWLEEAMPLLLVHLGGGMGALQVRSDDAELNCQIVTTTPKGAVSLQSL
ncbi:MAG TPA: hypothetical protein VMT54_07685 [Candidatus Cybelea sp.]|nr:hypothetical protein [Candidatus Cybelea sp.]